MSETRDQVPLSIPAKLVTIAVNCAAVEVATSETMRTFTPRLKQIAEAAPGLPVPRPNRTRPLDDNEKPGGSP